MQNLEEP